MQTFLTSRFNPFAAAGLAMVIAVVLMAPAPANATPYVVKLTQQGSNVVAIGSGSLDLTGLTFSFTNTGTPGVIPNLGIIGTGSMGSPADSLYTGITGPASFGTGGTTFASSGNGDFVGVAGSLPGSPSLLSVPQGYVSDGALSDTSTYDGATFASLGVTPGTYVWTWGAGPDQSFTLDAVTSVPEPAELGMFGLGLVLLGGFLGRRRRSA